MPQNQNATFTLQKVFAIILLLLLVQISFAQTKYGVTAGIGKTSLYKFPVAPQDDNCYKGQTSWWAGLTLNKTLIENNLSLFASAVYNKKGYKYALLKENGTTNTIKDSSFSQDLNYADINLNIRKKFMFGEESTNSFFIGTGPMASLLLNGKDQVQANYFGSKPSLNNTNSKLVKGSGAGQYNPAFFSWNFSIGVELTDLSVWINTGIALSDYFHDAQKAETHKIKTFGINVSYDLYTHHKKERTEKEPRVKHDPVPPVVKDTLLTDTDGDGIADINDRCPTVKGVGRYSGCPVPDTDGDGVNDEEDRCKTIPGTAANHGCPAVDTAKPVSKDTLHFIIYFEPGKSILRSDAYETLSKVVAMVKANSKLAVICNGHTDYVGNEEANYNRSLGRATVCADYISSFYIDKKRVTIHAFGNKMPVADLTDPLVQWKNRRVEILVFESNE